MAALARILLNLRIQVKLIFYSADSQVIERTRESALETRLGTTFPVIG
jgi:hypothetical protein